MTTAVPGVDGNLSLGPLFKIFILTPALSVFTVTSGLSPASTSLGRALGSWLSRRSLRARARPIIAQHGPMPKKKSSKQKKASENSCPSGDEKHTCRVCDHKGCKNCIDFCTECGAGICEEHQASCEFCKETLCNDDEGLDDCLNTCDGCDADMCNSCTHAYCDVCDESFCKGCWKPNSTCDHCDRSICKACSHGDDHEPENELRGCCECHAVICAACCGTFKPVDELPGPVRECLPHLAPLVALENRCIEARGATADPDRFGHGKEAARLREIDDRAAIAPVAERCFGFAESDDDDDDEGGKFIFVPSSNAHLICSGCDERCDDEKGGCFVWRCKKHAEEHATRCSGRVRSLIERFKLPLSLQAPPPGPSGPIFTPVGAGTAANIAFLQVVSSKANIYKLSDSMRESDLSEKRLVSMRERRDRKKKGPTSSAGAGAAASSTSSSMRMLTESDAAKEARAAKAAQELLDLESRQAAAATRRGQQKAASKGARAAASPRRALLLRLRRLVRRRRRHSLPSLPCRNHPMRRRRRTTTTMGRVRCSGRPSRHGRG